MSGAVLISIVSSGQRAGAADGVLVRIYPAGGRTIERLLPGDAVERVDVAAGEVAIEALFSSGETRTLTAQVGEGEERRIALEVAGSPHESMRYLSLARDPRPSTATRGGLESFPSGPIQESFPVDAPVQSAHAVSVVVRVEPDLVTIGNDVTYPEARVLHVVDRRGQDVFHGTKGSALAFLRIASPDGGQVRLAALPGPKPGTPEAHAALRPRAGAPLPDLQLVAASGRLAPITGFLERRDQRALSSLREPLVRLATEAMQQKMADPIGGAFGLAALLRLGELAPVKDWSGNLWRWFPGLPDGGALHAATLLRAPSDTKPWWDELREAALGAAHAGAPLLADSVRHLRDALALLGESPGPDALRVRAAARWCDRLVRAMDPDAVFTTVTLRPGEVDLVWGYDMQVGTVEALRKEFEPILVALREHATTILAVPGLAVARPGYALAGEDKRPALVLAFHPGRRLDDASLAALTEKLGVAVRATTASPEEQIAGAHTPAFRSPLQNLLDPIDPSGFAPPQRGTYEPPSGPGAPTLRTVDAEMELTACASPDAGWPVLRDFLAEGIEQRLTLAMYDFTAPHVEEAVIAALRDGDATLRLVIDAKTASGGVGGNGINGDDRIEAEVMKRLRKVLKDRFELTAASVGSGRAVPRAYHIKVASVDGSRVWVSSGNLQSSNLAPFDFRVPGDKPPFPLSRYNRDYHVVLKSPALAKTFAAFIDHDASLGGDFGAPEDEPELLIPEEIDFAPARRFPPLTVKRRVKVTPLLTPDNFPRFVNERLAAAKRRVWIQNQYIQPKADGDNFPEFDKLMELLGKLAGEVDLRLCLRGVAGSDRDRLLAAGVRPSQIRRQSNCHAKLLVIDDLVIVGSQNFSNLGFVANRDASLAIEDAEVVDYFAQIHETDWARATPIGDDDDFGVRLAESDETPPGFVRVPWSSVFDTPPPAPPLGAVPTVVPSAPVNGAPVAVAPPSSIPFFGVDEAGHRLEARVADVAAAIRAARGAVDTERGVLGRMTVTSSFGIPPGAAAERLEDVGWGVVWAPGTPKGVKEALAPLLAHRRAEVADDLLFHELDHVPGEAVRAFLQRNGSDYGAIKPQSVPYYLLLVGDPQRIPFSFQTLLDVEYRVGRLDFGDDAAAYRRYAETVVNVETAKLAKRERVLHTFGPANEGDAPTMLSAKVLVEAATAWLAAFPKLKARHGLDARVDARDAATKQRLIDILRGVDGRPEILLTASHGLLLSASHAEQEALQGALITADWDGFGGIDATARLAAADVPGDADVGGMVAFLFACFGGGTPATDSFPTRAGQKLAARPFVSALPRALLAHPRGSALGVFSHIDRALVWSLQPPQAGVATDPFAHAALNLLAGNRLGAALDDLNQRGATLATSVAQALTPSAVPVADADLVRTWTQQRDAESYILLGDPAARLPRG